VSRAVAAAFLIAALGCGFSYLHASGASEPVWAYGFLAPPALGDAAPSPQVPVGHRVLRPGEDPVEMNRPRHVPGSSRALSMLDLRTNLSNTIDWFPEEHPPMPDVVRHGPASLGSAKGACGGCHLANGRGRPENAQPGGLPAAYFIRQIRDFRLGFRRSADWRKPNTYMMIALASAMSDQEIHQTAEYFAANQWTGPWVRVVESERVPKTRIALNLFIATERERTEPIAGRIIEVPEDEEQAEINHNAHSGFVAYVPPGSISRGEHLVTTGGARIIGGEVVSRKTLACTSCHGPDLMGIDDVPPLAGRSPSYMARQIYDFQQGTRNGAMSALMKPVVARLTEEDIVAITAYVASRPPRRTATPIVSSR
jgi:cytochrome c553